MRRRSRAACYAASLCSRAHRSTTTTATTRKDCDAANFREHVSEVVRGNIAGKISVMALTLRIGSRPSALALAQANLVKARLRRAGQGPRIEINLRVEIVPISTSGDKMTSASLAPVGGQGLFTRELRHGLHGRPRY